MAIDPRDLRLRRLTDRALRDSGALPLAFLLEHAVPVARLRQLAQQLGLSPKGFRVDRAPARVLAPLLAEQREVPALEQVVALLLADAPPGGDAADAEDPAAPSADDADAAAGDRAAASRFQHQEIERLRAELERARQGAARAQERESGVRQAAQRDAEQVQMLRAELQRVQLQRAQAPAAGDQAGDGGDRDAARRLHELESERLALAAADEELRQRLAAERTHVRELEDEVAELEGLLPKGRRRKAPPEPPPEPARRFLLPYFLPSFYRSLVGKDRKSVERALQAVLLFCTEGHAYPGLEVKHLGGQDTWSLRASLGLRVYFQHRDDGDVEFLEVADREEQHTTLRRLKER